MKSFDVSVVRGFSLLMASLCVVGLSVSLMGCGGSGDGGGDEGSPAETGGGGEVSEGGGDGDAGASAPAAQEERDMDPTNPVGSANVFIDTMASGDFTGAAELTDPESEGREAIIELGNQIDRILEDVENPDLTDEQRQTTIQLRNLLARPYRNASASLESQEGGFAIVDIEFMDSSGEVVAVAEDLRMREQDGVWLLIWDESKLFRWNASDASEMPGAGGGEGGVESGGDEGEGNGG